MVLQPPCCNGQRPSPCEGRTASTRSPQGPRKRRIRGPVDAAAHAATGLCGHECMVLVELVTLETAPSPLETLVDTDRHSVGGRGMSGRLAATMDRGISGLERSGRTGPGAGKARHQGPCRHGSSGIRGRTGAHRHRPAGPSTPSSERRARGRTDELAPRLPLSAPVLFFTHAHAQSQARAQARARTSGAGPRAGGGPPPPTTSAPVCVRARVRARANVCTWRTRAHAHIQQCPRVLYVPQPGIVCVGGHSVRVCVCVGTVDVCLLMCGHRGCVCVCVGIVDVSVYVWA
jgi:hypothetical protein